MQLNQIDWGDDSAEKDENLLEYFVSSDAFDRLINRRRSLVVGRKGSGKSALLKKLDNYFSNEENTHVVKITPNFNTLRVVLNDTSLQTGFGEEIFFQHTWLRQILISCLCKIGHRAKGTYCSGSLAFARSLAKSSNATSRDLVENIIDILKRLKLKVGNLGEFGLSLEKEFRNASDIEEFQHHTIELCKGGARFVALVDDLDLGWDNSQTANNLLLGLLLASNCLSALNKSIHTVVFLREDVYTILIGRTQHADKYRDVERIRWTQHQLIKILGERINFNRRRDGEDELDNPFYSVSPQTIGTSNTDNWLVERTLFRPRELIQLARYYTQDLKSEEPSDRRLKDSEQTYSRWKLDDLCAEYSNQYPDLISVMTYWRTNFSRHRYHLKREEIEHILMEIMINVPINEQWFNRLVTDTDIGGFLSILYEIGFIGDFVLGGRGGSQTFYSYQERHEPRFDEVQVHPCFRRAVNTVERIRNR
ncbi:MAG: P-loop ATPase, Sll1717 family [Candidatus Competibacterales bacterium]